MENKLLEKEELQTLKDFRVKEENIILSFGQLGYQRAQLDEQEDDLLDFKKKFNKERSDFATSLTTKYGDGTINIETGEITPTK
ncbi:hypothetical protein N9145_01765 [bacterium]|nr:hypothetical protein [bacterium]|tara:strand:+ start:39 stop:290 length:252 start_codon:yes stop_codon:yes gene_type:complete